ncbi:MAG: hypothetical protein WCL10_17910 [Novosphingobium sp.]|uniref:COG3904 family protein n=1 Tax=Novosphingobium sp. TaxID=1874826 RepID=UPI003019E14C
MKFWIASDAATRVSNKLLHGEDYIYAEGEISQGTAEQFAAFVKREDITNARVFFNSPGGSLLEGIKLGRLIRSLGFDTGIGVYSHDIDQKANSQSICASACAYSFAGGVNRFLDESSGKLGLHQFYGNTADDLSGEMAQQISGLLVTYLDAMGVDAKAFAISTTANRDGMVWLNPEDARTLRFANNGSELPTAEIKLADMQPYLRIQQNHYNVTTRVLFLCFNQKMAVQYGIVTEPTTAAMFAQNQKRSYFELDNSEFMVVEGRGGATAQDSTTWLERELTPSQVRQIINANRMDAWIDGFGAVRYGAPLDLPTVRDEITDFARQCYGVRAEF